MAFTADELENINNTTLEQFIDRGTVFQQFVANKPMLEAFNASAGSFAGGKENVSFAVSTGYGGGTLQGYSGDDQVSYNNSTGTKRARFAWREHHIGITYTFTELKIDGIEINENGADQTTSPVDGREMFALANLLDQKMKKLGNDYAYSLDRLIHGDGSADPKALAGIRSIILDNPLSGTTGGIGRAANPFWRNRAATAAYGSAGGQGAITSATTNGGALIEFLEKEWLQLSKYRQYSPRYKLFAGSDFIAAYQKELRANGNYTMTGWQGQGNADGGMDAPKWKGTPIVWDPTLDDTGYSKRMYVLDFGEVGLNLQYLNGKRMKKHNPARPYDRYVVYNGITTTAVLLAKQLNTSGVYDIA